MCVSKTQRKTYGKKYDFYKKNKTNWYINLSYKFRNTYLQNLFIF